MSGRYSKKRAFDPAAFPPDPANDNFPSEVIPWPKEVKPRPRAVPPAKPARPIGLPPKPVFSPPGRKPLPLRGPWRFPKPGRLPLPGWWQFIGVLELADGMYEWWKNRTPYWPHPNLYPYMRLACDAGPRPPIYPIATHLGYRAGNVNGNNCGLELQSWPGAGALTQPFPGGNYPTGSNGTYVVLDKRSFDPLVWPSAAGSRFRYDQVWHLTIPSGATIGPADNLFIPLPLRQLPSPGMDPNRQRGLPGKPPLPDPPDYDPLPGNVPPPMRRVPAGSPMPGPGPGRVGGRRPPGPRERERKAKSTMVHMLSILDAISEGAEVVDAIYDALPDDVKRKWDRKGRGLIDNAGQYGIDGADWKLKALWHNWDKVDIDQAARNILANHIQDSVLGSIYRKLPRNVGGAVDEGVKGANEVLESIFEVVGLN